MSAIDRAPQSRIEFGVNVEAGQERCAAVATSGQVHCHVIDPGFLKGFQEIVAQSYATSNS